MKILAIQGRMGIGDTIIFLPFIKAISEKFNTPVSILVKDNSKADQYLFNADYIDEIILELIKVFFLTTIFLSFKSTPFFLTF